MRRFEAETGFLVPDYAAYGIAQIAPTVRALFGAGPSTALRAECPESPPPTVVLLVVDGFGWSAWERYAPRHAFFRRFAERGRVRPITTVFPSSTAPALSTLHTGLPPAAHGLVEWWTYAPEAGEVIETLPFRRIGGKAGELESMGVAPSVLLKAPTVHQALASAGVESQVLLNREFWESAYSRAAARGGMRVPTDGLRDMLGRVRSLAAEGRRRFVWTYVDSIDHTAHVKGPDTPAHEESVAQVASVLEEELIAKGGGLDLLLLVTADHGHVAMDPDRTVYLSAWPEVREMLGRAPWGMPRDMILEAKAERLGDLEALLRERLAGEAEVVRTEEAIGMGLFGGEPPAELRPRFGNLLVLPRAGRTVWWEHVPGRRFMMRGIHGGLTPEEVRVPFAVGTLEQLRG